MLSRALPTLIKFNRTVKIINTEKSLSLFLSRPSVIKRCPGPLHFSTIQVMSADGGVDDPRRHLDYDQLIERKDKKNVIIIDVREYSEIEETGKIPQSVNIPLNDLQHALKELSSEEFLKLYKSPKPNINDEIIFSCKSGRRSVKALEVALALGYKKAGSYKGGWTEWALKTNPT